MIQQVSNKNIPIICHEVQFNHKDKLLVLLETIQHLYKFIHSQQKFPGNLGKQLTMDEFIRAPPPFLLPKTTSEITSEENRARL